MNADAIVQHFLDRAAWVDRAATVDRVIIGDPDKEITSCVVTWISSFAAVRHAVARGVDLLVTHEPTFYEHARELDSVRGDEDRLAKKRYIDEHGLVIVRLHDTWDRWPEIGIPWAWAAFLGFGGRPVSVGADGYQHRYDIEPARLHDLARRIAARTATIHEACVQTVGDADQTVSRIGVGTGCGCSIAEFRRMGCDASIVCDDGSCYWRDIQRAEDAGHAVIRVNHGTSEEPGMVTLACYVNDTLKIRAEHLPHGATFRLVGAGK